jgi:large subunit ribosomal protein L15e
MSSRAIQLRREPTIIRLEKPSRIDRARMLGYKAKQGVVVVRIHLSRGGMRRKRPTSGRRSKHMGVLRMKSDEPVQGVAERRVGEKFPNLKLLGSYVLWKDGKHSWYECILIDPNNPSISRDYNYRRVLGIS